MTRFWLVKNINYEQALKLVDGDLIQCVQRDQRNNEARYFPGSPAVYTYLRQKLPDATIVDDMSVEGPAFHKPTPAVHTARQKAGRGIDG